MVLNLTPDTPPPADRTGPWMMTVSGRRIYPDNCVPGDFFIADIAHGLSNVCRYGGQCLRFYSVAEHCVRGSYLARTVMGKSADQKDVDQLAWEFLLHDATEAYIGDMVGPMKRHMDRYRQIEADMDKCIRERFRVRTWVYYSVAQMTRPCREIDNRLLVTEAPDMFPQGAEPWWTEAGFAQPFGVADGAFSSQHGMAWPAKFHGALLDPSAAKHVFLQRFNELRMKLHPLMTEGCEQ